MSDMDQMVDAAAAQYLDDLQQRLLALAEKSEYVDFDPDRRTGGGVGLCPTGYWRGKKFCLHTIVKLRLGLAPNTGSLYIDPLQGSYTYSTSASGGTHGGGGAGDVKHGSWSETQDNSVMNIARNKAFLIYWDRDAIPGVWDDHGHFIDPSCPNLSPEAAAQVVDFHYGRNGLANDGADFGSRTNATRLWNMYLNRSKTTVASIEALFPSAPAPAPAPVQTKEWWEMAIPKEDLDAIVAAVWATKVKRRRPDGSIYYVSALQELADAKSAGLNALERISDVERAVLTHADAEGGGVVNPQ